MAQAGMSGPFLFKGRGGDTLRSFKGLAIILRLRIP